MKRIRLLTISVVSYCIVAAFTCGRAEEIATSYQPLAGQPHADFLLPHIATREPVSLSKYRGKKVLLLHFASW